MDRESFNQFYSNYLVSLDDINYIEFIGEDYENNKQIHAYKRIYKRGSKGYARKIIKPLKKKLYAVADTIDELSPNAITVAFFTFTCDVKQYGSASGAWAELPDDVNKALCWLRNGTKGKRVRKVNGRSFNYKRPKMIAYVLVYEDTEAGYPAPHLIVIFDNSTFSPYAQRNPRVKKRVLRLVNDELTARYGQGYTKISEKRKGRKPAFGNVRKAITYTTKYLSKGFDPDNIKFSQKRSIEWIVRLKSQGKRAWSMSKRWNVWHEGITTTKDPDLNLRYKANSKVIWHFNGIVYGCMDVGDRFTIIIDRDFSELEKPPPDYGSQKTNIPLIMQSVLD
jgi:hypothetical protein